MYAVIKVHRKVAKNAKKNPLRPLRLRGKKVYYKE
jgi:hypothetical protein